VLKPACLGGFPCRIYHPRPPIVTLVSRVRSDQTDSAPEGMPSLQSWTARWRRGPGLSDVTGRGRFKQREGDYAAGARRSHKTVALPRLYPLQCRESIEAGAELGQTRRDRVLIVGQTLGRALDHESLQPRLD